LMKKNIVCRPERREWLGKVFVKTIYKNSPELKEINGETNIILTLQP
jgi:hypothetical protein